MMMRQKGLWCMIFTRMMIAVLTAENITDKMYHDKINRCADFCDWNCEDYAFLLQDNGNSVAMALHCMEYDKYSPPWDQTYISVCEWQELETLNLTTTTFFARASIMNIKELNEESQTITFYAHMSMGWHDHRFAFPTGCYDPDDPSSMALEEMYFAYFWIPDVFIDNLLYLKKIQGFKTAAQIKIKTNGDIEVYARYEVALSCRMDFTDFPFDQQTCNFDMSINDASIYEAQLYWDMPVEKTTNVSGLYVPHWTTDIHTKQNLIKRSIENAIDKPVIRFSFNFERVYTNHILHTFIPSIMLCTGSCLSVFVPSDLVPGRMGLCVTTFLSIISLFNGARDSWPSTSYMKAMDSWTIGCYITVFYALFEYCIILYLTQSAEWEQKVQRHHKAQRHERQTRIQPQQTLAKYNKSEKIYDIHGNLISRREIFATRLEAFSRFILPVYFIVFNIIFWIHSLV